MTQSLEDWSLFIWARYPNDLGSKGSRKQFLDEMKKLKPDDELRQRIDTMMSSKIRSERKLKAKGEFIPGWPNFCRMIKRQFWDDDILSTSMPATNPQSSCECALCHVDVSLNGMSAKTPQGQLCADCYRQHYADMESLRDTCRDHGYQHYTPQQHLDAMRAGIKRMVL